MIIRLFAPGIGDLVVQHGMIRTLKEAGHTIFVWCKSKAQAELLVRSPWVDCSAFVPEGAEESLRRDWESDSNPYIDEADTWIESKFYWGDKTFIDTFGKIHISEVIDLMFDEKVGVKAGYNYEDTLFEMTFYDPSPKTILLAPGGRRGTKLWPTEYWVALYKRLLKNGYNPLLIGADTHAGSEQLVELRRLGLPHRKTQHMSQMVDAIGGAGAVIGVDNGLIHLGASMATPTVAIFGPMPAWLWGPRGDIHINIQGDCKIDCTRQPMDWRCDSQICTNAISPIEVFNSLEELGVRD